VKLLFGFLAFLLIEILTVKLLYMLESVDDERSESEAVKNLVVVYFQCVDGMQTLDLRKQDEAAEVIVGQNNAFQLCELFEFL
jgi:hypothetical protein